METTFVQTDQYVHRLDLQKITIYLVYRMALKKICADV